MGHLTDSITKLEQHLLGVAGKWPACQRLQELPGIGKILGLTIALETGAAQRFAGAGNFASYSRSREKPAHEQRPEEGREQPPMRQQISGLGLRGSRALCLPLRCDQCRRFYDRKKQPTNPVVATKSLACKLAKAAWPVLAQDVPFDAERVFGPARKTDFGETGREPAKGSGHPSQQN